MKAKLTLTRPADSDSQRRVLRIYKSGISAADGAAEKPVYLVSLTREYLRHGFDLYAVPSPTPATLTDITSFQSEVETSHNLAVLARHDVEGQTQDLLVQVP